MMTNLKMYSRNSIALQLIDLGLKPNDLVMFHSSMRAIGSVIGGPDQVHLAIMDVITHNGTLFAYIACEREYEAVGRGNLSAEEEAFILKNCPPFDPLTARARRDHGILAEFFRSWPGVQVSHNPGARIAALGAHANDILQNHPLNYGYGPGTPLQKIYQTCKILFLGSDLDSATILHYAEHISPIKDKRIQRYKVPLLQNGERVWVDVEEYDTSEGICPWPERFFEKIIKKYFEATSIQPKKVGNADSYLVDAKSLVDFAIPILVEEERMLQCDSH